ncbi:MAG: ABC transporter ATP-binding protein [bacterium]
MKEKGQQETIKSLKISNLSFQYDGSFRNAISNICINLYKNTMTLILGGSGSGKSTLLFAIAGLIPKFIPGNITGNIFINHRNIQTMKPVDIAAKFGLVFQDFKYQLFSTDVLTETAFYPSNLGLAKNMVLEYAINSLKLLNIEHLKERNPETLSGGEKQRLAVASIISANTPIIALDEALTDIDVKGRDALIRLFRNLCSQGKIIIIADEDISNYDKYDNIFILKNGEVIKSGSPSSIIYDRETLIKSGIKPPDISLITNDVHLESIDDAYDFLIKRDIKYIPTTNYFNESLNREPIIIIKNISFSYDEGDEILKDVSLIVQKGELLTLLGPNGSGKTTLAGLIMGFYKPQSGEVLVKGIDPSVISPKKLCRIIGFLFQDPDHQIFSETIFDEVAFGLNIQNLKPEIIKEKVYEYLNYLNLNGKESEDPYSLNKGGRQRLALASILSLEPDIIILDEPTTGLDFYEIRKLMKTILNLKDNGKTIICITHSIWLASEYSDRIALMKGGKIIKVGSPFETFSDVFAINDAQIKRTDIMELSFMLGGFATSIGDFYLNFDWKGKDVPPITFRGNI